jgi:hypothetical protein
MLVKDKWEGMATCAKPPTKTTYNGLRGSITRFCKVKGVKVFEFIVKGWRVLFLKLVRGVCGLLSFVFLLDNTISPNTGLISSVTTSCD